ncbi:uncharacterized protein LOC121235501 [Juglans microcarpa x Juglans regia]|uniref:uncharacterized protein LOC121235501 n=1 Tax=Juglans microcarpa x Juglans regia TaxID=2249226 RepID=UPI001B7E9BD0|nr:uncharacterized protein LOC121235501 [Juglans microcarpa x Juglans regia]
MQVQYVGWKVSSLIDKPTCSWNQVLLREMVNTEEGDVISRIPISVSNAPDKLVCRCSSDDKFSVKSAYHLLRVMEAIAYGESSKRLLRKDLWAMIWKLNTTNAVKMMIWRACHESLPTNQILFKRKIVESPLCPVCRMEPESASHILWRCKSTQDVWRFSFKRLQKVVVLDSSFKDLLWKRRNAVVFEAEHGFQGCYQKIDQGRVVESQIVSQWRAPPLHVFKVNCDASVDKVNCRVGVGVIVRDWTGKVIGSLRSQRDLFPDAYLAEAFATLKAVILGKQLGLQSIILEGDAQKVVNDIKGAVDHWTPTGLMISDIRLLLQHFQHWSVSFIPRKCNGLAHCLANDALKLYENSIILEGVPPCIRSMLHTI